MEMLGKSVGEKGISHTMVHSDAELGIASDVSFSRDKLGVFSSLEELKDNLVNHPLLRQMSDGTLPLRNFQKALINFYPLVEHFPKYMALNMAKTRENIRGHREAKEWLISNIKVELNHAKWYRLWAKGFGVSEAELLDCVQTPKCMAIVNYLWSVSRQGSLAEALAATNVGVEWATGEWSVSVAAGVRKYMKNGKIREDKRVLTWLDAHANYDDLHPYEAMALVMKTSRDVSEINSALQAAETSLRFYIMGLDDCLNA